LSQEKREKEREIIQDILYNNGYSTSILKSISNPKKTESDIKKTHWAKFTYSAKRLEPSQKFSRIRV
jgi:hypothetical protein